MNDDLTPGELDRLEELAGKATTGKRFVGGPLPCITVCIELSPPYWNPACPESYDPGHVEPLLDFWTNEGEAAPGNIKADAEMFSALDPDTIRKLVRMARRGMPEPPVDIKAVVIARHNRVNVGEDAATAVVDWLAELIMPEIK